MRMVGRLCAAAVVASSLCASAASASGTPRRVGGRGGATLAFSVRTGLFRSKATTRPATVEVRTVKLKSKRRSLRRIAGRGLAAAGALVSRKARAAGDLMVSLDTPLPSSSSKLAQGGVSNLLVPALLLAVAFALLRSVAGSGGRSAAADQNEPGLGEFITRKYLSPPPAVVHRLKLLKGKGANFADSVRDTWTWVMPPQREQLGDGEWAACTLAGKTPITGSGCTRYSFRLNSARQTFGLGLGQALSLIGIDEANRVLKVHMIPATPRLMAGSFDLILPDEDIETKAQASRSLTASNAEEEGFGAMVQTMELGEQIAAKPGDERLTYDGYLPIDDVHCIASGLGIVPALGLLNELLPSRASSVETANLVWVNEDEGDFVNYVDMENVWYKFSKKLDVSCVLDNDTFGSELWENEAFIASVPDSYVEGMMIVVAGPENFQLNVAKELAAKDFPEGAIVCL
uniref:FAD-binding FR-type domain-containing protein n=1 Tax=Florenciella parvula TaxID=236787 RepID=A0A7S2FHA9_9STRA|mmetsp:Transcript_15433/g.32253  ORF Transcript_15433/g.32253 Transcript_15433/m.32253 type:complete len:460 (+) Transcript_15433:36-1415(+)